MSTLRSLLRWEINMCYRAYIRGAKVFQNSGNNLKILGARRVTLRKFYTERPEILGATLHNLVARAAWRSGFVHPCPTCIKGPCV
jgi:hypothetical protein